MKKMVINYMKKSEEITTEVYGKENLPKRRRICYVSKPSG